MEAEETATSAIGSSTSAIEAAERAGVMAYLKDAVAVLLEVRPTDPYVFLNAYFRHAARPNGDPTSLAWYLIRACPRSRPCFRDNLHAAYSSLLLSGASGGGSSSSKAGPPGRSSSAVRGANVTIDKGITSVDCASLVRELCRQLPTEVADSLFAELRQPPRKLVNFKEFMSVVESCLATEEAFRAATRLFDTCDLEGRGSMPRDDFLSELDRHHRRLHKQRRRLGRESRPGTDTVVDEDSEDDDDGDSGHEDDTLLLVDSYANFADAPPADQIEAQLAEFDDGTEITADDLFVAMWRIWRGSGNANVGDKLQFASSAP